MWLAEQPGYKSRISYADTEYFNLNMKDTRIAKATREPRVPTLEQIHHVLHSMPDTTEIEVRDRALIAFTILTGARDGAIASLKLKHVDLDRNLLEQDAREVRTKASKSFPTFFFPVGGNARAIVADWVIYLGLKDCLGSTIRYFRQALSGWGRRGNFKPTVWAGGTGRTPGLSGRFSRQRSNGPGCRISIHIHSASRSPSSVRNDAATSKP